MAKFDLTFDIFGRDKTASKALKGVGDEAGRTSKRMDGFKVAAGAALAAAGVAAVKFASDSVKAYTESQTAQAKLDDAYARFPALAKGNADALRALGAERAKVTRFDDDATAAAAAQLAQFGLNQAQLEAMIPLVQDYAAKTGQDLGTASAKVGKALLGNTKALKELGINYKPTGDKAKDYANIQALLNKQVGGFAEQEGKTAAGQAAILSNQFGEVQETVGAALLPALMTLADFAINTLIPAVQGIAEWVGRNSDVILPLAGFVAGLVGAIKLWTIAQAALNVVMALNPIGLVVIAIAALVAALVLAWNKSETFRKIVTGAWTSVKVAAEKVGSWFMNTLWPLLKRAIDFVVGYYRFLWTTFQTVAGWIIEKGAALVGWFRELPDKVRNAVGGLWDGIVTSFKSAINTVIRLWNDFRLTLGGQEINFGPLGSVTIPRVVLDTPNIPYLAQGGVVTRPTLAMIGEAGPEAVIPLNRAGIGGNGGQVVNVYVTQPLGTPEAVGRAVGSAITTGVSRGTLRKVVPGRRYIGGLNGGARELLGY